MSSDALHFISEARLAQTLRFIDASNASLSRLIASHPAGRLGPDVLRQFADMAAAARQLQAQILADLAPLFATTGDAIPLSEDPAARRLIVATRRVAEHLDEMIHRLDLLQENGAKVGCIGT